MSDLTPEKLADLRRLLDDMRALATREGIYNGNRAILDIIGRVEPLLDAAAERDALAALRAAAEAIARAYRAHAECAEGLLVDAGYRQGDRDALRVELAHMTEARDNARAEVERLAAKVERVRRECVIGKGYAGWAAMSRAVLAILDEEPQP